MKYLDISNTSERMIKFGLSMPDRYKAGEVDTDPWWNVHLIVKKDCARKKIDFSFAQESMTTFELKELVKEIEKTLFFIPERVANDSIQHFKNNILKPSLAGRILSISLARVTNL